MFTFKETIKASKYYSVCDTRKTLENIEKRDGTQCQAYIYLLMQTTDYTDKLLLNGGQLVMAAQSKSFSDFKKECLDGGNEAAELEEMFITRKGNKYIYWRDIETKEDFLTKFEEDLILC